MNENTLMIGKSHSCLLDLGRTRPKSSEFNIDENGNEIAKTGKTSILTPTCNNSLDITPLIERFNIFIQLNIEQEHIDDKDTPLVVTVPFEEFLLWSGFSPREKNQRYHQKNQLNQIFEILLSKSIAYNSDDFIPYLDSAVIEKGEIIVTINSKFKQSFLSNKFAKKQGNGSFIFAAPWRLGKVKTKHKLFWSTYCKLFSQSNSNTGDKNSNILSVSKLLDYLPVSPNIPNKYKTRQLVQPLENSLNQLQGLGIVDWDYCHEKSEPLTANEQRMRLSNEGNEVVMPFEVISLSKLLIYWEWTDDALINYFNDHKVKRDEVKIKKSEAKEKKKTEAVKREKRIQKKTEDNIAAARAKSAIQEQ